MRDLFSGIVFLFFVVKVLQSSDENSLVVRHSRYDSTNVLRALSEAVMLRNPSYVFPVQDLDTFQSIDKFRNVDSGRLRDCVCLKPQTTLFEAFRAMSEYPVHLLAGDFVRAEVGASLSQNKF